MGCRGREDVENGGEKKTKKKHLRSLFFFCGKIAKDMLRPESLWVEVVYWRRETLSDEEDV